MGEIEKKAKQLRRRGYIQKALLSALGITGILLVGATAPNLIQLLERFGPDKYKLKYQLKSATSRLVMKGLIRFIEKNGKKYLQITENGRRALAFEQQKIALQSRSQKRWDKRWRMIVFDIPEKYRKTRDRLRNLLKSLGFEQLQGSVWIYPYDCEDVLQLVKAELGSGKGIIYAVVEQIEHEQDIKKIFNLD